MIIGTSRIGIGRIGIRSANASILELLSNCYIKDSLVKSLLTGANIVDVYLLPIYSNCDIDLYHHRELLTTCSIKDDLILQVLASCSIADQMALSMLTNANIITTVLLSMLSSGSILGPVDMFLSTNCSICGPANVEIITGANVAERIALEMLSNGYIYDTADVSLDTNGNIALFYFAATRTNGDIVDIRYWAIGQAGDLQNISGQVYVPESRGFGLKVSTQRIAEARRVTLRDEGIDSAERVFYVLFKNYSERQIFQEHINNDSEDLLLYFGRSDRYHVVKKISVEPGEDELWRGLATLKVTCLMEDPYQYHELNQGVDFGANTLPFTSTSVYNYGTTPAPFLFKIGGFYSSGQLTLPYAKLMNGASEEMSIALGPGLLSKEFAELTLEGSEKYYLEHTYQDDFSNNDYWPKDATNSGCTLSGGQVSVPSGAYFYYKFQGHPLKENIRLIAKITKSGSPLVQYSTDGSTWYTAISASEIVSAVTTEYWLTGTEKQSTVYVRFYSPAGSSMTIQDVDFLLLRDISAQYASIPMVEPGQFRTMKIAGSGSTKARVQTAFRSRWYAS